MKILLDECLPQDLCKSFVHHECSAARAAGFGAKKNGELLTLAEQAGFDVLVTVDKNIAYQQNLGGRTIAVLIIRPPSNRLPDLLPFVPACVKALQSITRGEIVRLTAV